MTKPQHCVEIPMQSPRNSFSKHCMYMGYYIYYGHGRPCGCPVKLKSIADLPI